MISTRAGTALTAAAAFAALGIATLRSPGTQQPDIAASSTAVEELGPSAGNPAAVAFIKQCLAETQDVRDAYIKKVIARSGNRASTSQRDALKENTEAYTTVLCMNHFDKSGTGDLPAAVKDIVEGFRKSENTPLPPDAGAQVPDFMIPQSPGRPLPRDERIIVPSVPQRT